MARKSEGWHLTPDPRTGNQLVRFHDQSGRRRNRSTGTRDLATAKIRAAKIYEEQALGKRQVERQVEALPLDELFAKWLGCLVAPDPDEETIEMFVGHARTHLIPFFVTLDQVALRYERYIDKRLAEVLRSTVNKELSTLRRFLKWLKVHGYIDEVPKIQNPPKERRGVAWLGGARKKQRVDLTEQEIDALLQALPETTRGGHHMRAFYTVAAELGLRRNTLASIEAPGDYYPGRESLRIRAEVDKARYERELPLTEPARAALDRACPKAGPIFGRFDGRYQLQKAALAVGIEAERAKHLSNHDFRHACITHWLEKSNSLVGAGYMAGHRHSTTTSIYVHGNRNAAAKMLASIVSGHQRDTDTQNSNVLADDEDEEDSVISDTCEKGGSNSRNRAPNEPRIIPKASQPLDIKNEIGLRTWDDL